MKLQRSNEGKLLTGVCAGISKLMKGKLNGQAWIWRILFFLPGLGLIAYFVLSLVLKDETGKRMSVNELIDETLGKLENKVDFPMSRAFWHTVSILCISAIIVGVIIFFYGFSPVVKHGVDKPKLLQQRDITSAEVLDCAKQRMPKQPVKKTVVKKKKVNNVIVEEEEEVDAEPPMISLELLQSVLPNIKFMQKGRKLTCDYSEGHYEYGDWGDWVYPSRCYEYGDVDSPKGKAVREQLQKWFPYDSVGQQGTVDALARHIAKYDQKSRNAIYEASWGWMKKARSFEQLWTIWEMVDNVIGNASVPTSTEKPEKLFAQIQNFMENNPNNGEAVLTKAIKLVELAAGVDRMQVFKIARAQYKAFGLDLEEWGKATDKFLAMNELHVQSMLPVNLECFYSLYWSEGENRIVENRRMQKKYESDLKAAEYDANIRKAQKRNLIPKSGIIIGAAVGVILLIAIILVLFSIQRTMVRIEEKLNNTEK
jgi:phage shock protein PspC (stress-responsive transcriptional regulator)